MGMVAVMRFSVWQVDLTPTRGSEQAGYRPAVVISPDEMNRHLKTVIVAPLTTRIRSWPTRVGIKHADKTGEVALDQIRAIDKTRLGNTMGELDSAYHPAVLETLQEMFTQ